MIFTRRSTVTLWQVGDGLGPSMSDSLYNRLIGCRAWVLALLALLAYGAEPALAESRPVVLACNDFPPLKIENPGPDGLRGKDVEAITEIARRSGLQLEPRFMPWNRAYAEASEGAIDGLCSCSFREDRVELFHFSDAIGETSVGVFNRAKGSNPAVTSIDDLRGRSIGVVKGYNLEKELADAGLSYETVSSDSLAHKMLDNGRFDHLYSFKAPINFLLRGSHHRDVAYTEFRNSPYFICLSKAVADTAEMMPRINAAIAVMRADGSFDEIERRYGEAAIN